MYTLVTLYIQQGLICYTVVKAFTNINISPYIKILFLMEYCTIIIINDLSVHIIFIKMHVLKKMY